MKHTPGPWEVGKSNTCTMDGFKVHRFPISGGGQAIASVWDGSVGKEALNFGNQEANARLIAAAPELLEACQLFMTAFNGTDPDKIQDSDPDSAAAIRAAITAIAKAKGEA